MIELLMGAATIVLMAGFAGLYAYAAISAQRPNAPRPRKQKKRHPLQDVADQQARNAEHRLHVDRDALSRHQFLVIAANRLIQLWPGFDFDRAMRELNDYLLDVETPDMDWSPEAAREIAECYASEYGEPYGANS